MVVLACQPERFCGTEVFPYADATGLYASKQPKQQRHKESENDIIRRVALCDISEEEAANQRDHEKDKEPSDDTDEPLYHAGAFHGRSSLYIFSPHSGHMPDTLPSRL